MRWRTSNGWPATCPLVRSVLVAARPSAKNSRNCPVPVSAITNPIAVSGPLHGQTGSAGRGSGLTSSVTGSDIASLSHPGDWMGDVPDARPAPIRFADTARAVAASARHLGLAVPVFVSPPRLPRVARTLRRRADGTAGVAVPLSGRPAGAVAAHL